MLIIPAILSSYGSLKDKTLKLNFQTNEPNPGQIIEIANSSGNFGYLIFKSENFTSDEIEKFEGLKTEFDTKKSKSKQLRDVFFILFNQNSEGFKTFESFYDHKMNQLIEHYKNKLQ